MDWGKGEKLQLPWLNSLKQQRCWWVQQAVQHLRVPTNRLYTNTLRQQSFCQYLSFVKCTGWLTQHRNNIMSLRFNMLVVRFQQSDVWNNINLRGGVKNQHPLTTSVVPMYICATSRFNKALSLLYANRHKARTATAATDWQQAALWFHIYTYLYIIYIHIYIHMCVYSILHIVISIYSCGSHILRFIGYTFIPYLKSLFCLSYGFVFEELHGWAVKFSRKNQLWGPGNFPLMNWFRFHPGFSACSIHTAGRRIVTVGNLKAAFFVEPTHPFISIHIYIYIYIYVFIQLVTYCYL